MPLQKDLIIQSNNGGVTIALTEDKLLTELHQEQISNEYAVGDIYLGRVKKIMPGLNAAFIDVGYEKDAFLHYLDLGPQVRSLLKYSHLIKNGAAVEDKLNHFKIEPDIIKTGKIDEVLSKNQLIPVQIAKEPISSKGPRLTSELSIAGRYIVLVPFSNAISVSKKIKSAAERTRLKSVIENIKPANFGVIIRTVSEGKGVQELHKDMDELIEKWQTFSNGIKQTDPGKKIMGELDKTSSLLRDILNDDFQSIAIDDAKLYEEVKHYISSIAPDKEKIVKHYKQREPIFETYGIERQIKSGFGKTVNFTGGAYLVIEHTEALHVIDVNSGNRTANESSQEENALAVNMEAAKEIARQLRLRDMGGIIVIDFIDMHRMSNRKILFDHLYNIMKADRAKHTILPPSKFGLVQITRQRVRPEMNLSTMEVCPTCAGTGEVRSSMVLVDDIQSNLHYVLNEQNEKKISLKANPYIAAYLKKGLWNSYQVQWFFKYKKWIKIEAVNSYNFLEYRFYNENNQAIIL